MSSIQPGDLVNYWVNKNGWITLPTDPNKTKLSMGHRVYAIARGIILDSLVVEYHAAPVGFLLLPGIVQAYRDRKYELAPDIDAAASIGKTNVEWFEETLIIVSPGISFEEKKTAAPIKQRKAGECLIDGNPCIQCGEYILYANVGIKCFSCRQDRYRCSTSKETFGIED